MAKISTSSPRIVVIGGGFGGLEAVFYLRQRLGLRPELTLVSEREQFLFKPNTIYIPFGKPAEDLFFKLAPVLEPRRISLHHARAHAIDSVGKRVSTTRGELAYDYLLVATGATVRPSEVPGLGEHADTVWTPEEMMHLRASLKRLVADARAGKLQRVLFLVPPNNKCSGPLYEMVLMLDTWLRRRRVRERVAIAYATYEKTFIQAFGPRLHGVIVGEFRKRQIAGETQKPVARIEPGEARFADGSVSPFDLLVSFPPYVAAQRWEGLHSDERGFLATDLRTRQVQGHPDIYAVGDASDFPVKQAFLALLQADAAAEHVCQRILGIPTAAHFEPVSMCIMEQFDRATFAQVPLVLTGDPEQPVTVDPAHSEMYKVGTGEIWRLGKKVLGAAIPGSFRHGQPFHAGPTWALLKPGVRTMSALFAD